MVGKSLELQRCRTFDIVRQAPCAALLCDAVCGQGSNCALKTRQQSEFEPLLNSGPLQQPRESCKMFSSICELISFLMPACQRLASPMGKVQGCCKNWRCTRCMRMAHPPWQLSFCARAAVRQRVFQWYHPLADGGLLSVLRAVRM